MRLLAGIHALIARSTDPYIIDQLKDLSDEVSTYDEEYFSAFEGMDNTQIATAICSLWSINTCMADCSRCKKRNTCRCYTGNEEEDPQSIVDKAIGRQFNF